MDIGGYSIWTIFLIIAITVGVTVFLLALEAILKVTGNAIRKFFTTSTSDRSSATSRSDHSTSSIRTHYDNLQVTENASIEVIRGAYKFLSQKWHPDKHPNDKERAARIMKVINEAYSVLSDPEQRKEHDAWIRIQHEQSESNEAPQKQSENNEAPQSENISEPIIFLAKIASGYFGLAKTFWVYGFMVRVVASVLLNIITSTTGFVMFFIVYSVYETLVLMGIWNASDNYKGLAIWAVLAKVTVVLGAIMLAVGLFVTLVLRPYA
jgi:hypothetical protein